MTRPSRRSATVGAATALAVVGAVAFVASAPPAVALFGDAVINPIESNLAGKFWTSVTASSGSTADLAVDDALDTAWVADEQAAGQWLSLDLGGAYDNLRRVEVVFPSAGAVYQYTVEASPDGQDWSTLVDRSTNLAPGRGGVDVFTRPGTRHVRVTITGATPGATIGISELRVFNYLRSDVVLGADLSMVDNFATRNYWVHPLDEDRGAGPQLLDVVKDRGMEYIRLRVWNEPRSEFTGNPTNPPRQGPARTLTSAQWVKERGLGLGIDFHYADSWADPGKQPKPLAWAALPFEELVTELHDWTYDYVSQLVAQGTTPDKVAIGNEVNNGFLWGSEANGAPPPGPVIDTANPTYWRNQPVYRSQPGGGIMWQYWAAEGTDPEAYQLYLDSWDRFTTLLAAGIAAVREASPTTKVEIHSLVGSGVGNRTGLEKAIEYWDQLLTRIKAKGQDIDVIGLSFYPEFHSTIEAFEFNMHTLASRYPGYEFEVAETAYPATGGGTQPNSTYPRTVQGQADAIQHVFRVINDLPDNRGIGALTWEPASFQPMFRAVPGMPNTWEPYTSFEIYNKSDATHVLQNRIYTATRVGAAPVLPASVEVLTTSTGAVTAVPVDWAAVPATDAPGQVSVTGTTEFGEVTAIIDVVTKLGPQPCSSVVDGHHTGPLVVSSGLVCVDGGSVTGPVTVASGAGLWTANGARITGSVSAASAAVISICDTRIIGAVTSHGAEEVTVGDPSAGCAPNTITGPVKLTNTTGPSVIAGNSIIGPLDCAANQPPPVNNGVPNQVVGPKKGQCASL